MVPQIFTKVNNDEDPNGSPLVTPRDEEKNSNDDALMEKVQILTQKSSVLDSFLEPKEEDSTAKSKGWKERLEKLKIKKAEEKKVVETNAG